MKSIMMSIKPKWVAKILNREKTIEVRKKFPSDYVGWVYIYCTKEDNLCCIRKISRDRYICGKDFDIKDFPNLSSGYDGKGKVVARFWCDKVDYYDDIAYWSEENEKETCLTPNDFFDYMFHIRKYRSCRFIHITKLEIFDEPRPLQPYFCLDRPPQSWRYIEEYPPIIMED